MGEVLDGEPAYVINSGRRDLFYRKRDGAWMLERLDGQVDIRVTPPRETFAWPLEVGKTWEQLFVLERPREGRSDSVLRVSRVEAIETVTVPAGTFRAFRVVARNKWNDQVTVESWYAPEVGQVVKTREPLAAGGEELRELVSHVPAPRAAAVAPPAASGSSASVADGTLSGTFRGTVAAERQGQRYSISFVVTLLQRGDDITGTFGTGSGAPRP